MRTHVRAEKIRETEGDCLDAELSPWSRSKFGGSVNIVPGYVEWRSVAVHSKFSMGRHRGQNLVRNCEVIDRFFLIGPSQPRHHK